MALPLIYLKKNLGDIHIKLTKKNFLFKKVLKEV